jgi:hypothetical protein
LLETIAITYSAQQNGGFGGRVEESIPLSRFTVSLHPHPHSLQIGRLLTAHRKIGWLRDILIVQDTPPHPGESLSDLTQEDFRFQAGGVGRDKQGASGFEHGSG